MNILKTGLLALVLATGLAGCAQAPKVYTGPEVTRVAVFKSSRRLYLFHNESLLRWYDINLGFAPVGDKLHEGDGRTPEGEYIIDRRNPDSRYHLSIGIDYPRPQDVAEARALGLSPGGDIFIHGIGTARDKIKPDWTYGCIAVTDEEIEEIYAMVKDGTPISIYE